MSFRSSKWFCIVCFNLHLLLTSAPGSAQDIELTAAPNKCVALNKGRTCYAQVVLSWKANQLGNYCLLESNTGKTLYCWRGQKAGDYLYSFASTSNQLLTLKARDTDKVLSKALIQVSWLYQSAPRKRRWRLF